MLILLDETNPYDFNSTKAFYKIKVSVRNNGCFVIHHHQDLISFSFYFENKAEI